jgi:hypothetical protein
MDTAIDHGLDSLTDLVRAVTGSADAEPFGVTTEPVDYQLGTPTTEELLRVRGLAWHSDGSVRPWSVFLKRLQSATHWEHLDLVPEPFREEFVRQIPWRLEIAVYTGSVRELLPDGLRLATAYRIDETGDGRASLWLEDVHESPAPWDTDRFARAAYLLGQLAGRRRPDLVPPLLPRPGVSTPGAALRYYFQGRVQLGALGPIADEQTWRHPLLAAALDGDHGLRADLLALGDRMPAVLDALDRLPQAYQHGDASPQNLLVPVEAPDTFVAIDVAFQSPQAVGFDLGQLLIGLAHAGELPPDRLAEVHQAILPAYTDGLNSERQTATLADVRLGYLGSLAARAAFTALPFELFGQPVTDDARAFFADRVRLTRFLVDLVSTEV